MSPRPAGKCCIRSRLTNEIRHGATALAERGADHDFEFGGRCLVAVAAALAGRREADEWHAVVAVPLRVLVRSAAAGADASVQMTSVGDAARISPDDAIWDCCAAAHGALRMARPSLPPEPRQD